MENLQIASSDWTYIWSNSGWHQWTETSNKFCCYPHAQCAFCCWRYCLILRLTICFKIEFFVQYTLAVYKTMIFHWLSDMCDSKPSSLQDILWPEKSQQNGMFHVYRKFCFTCAVLYSDHHVRNALLNECRCLESAILLQHCLRTVHINGVNLSLHC